MLTLITAASAPAGNSMICYRDGTVIVREAKAIKGLAEIPLAAGLLEGTLKVEPSAGTTITKVDLIPGRVDNKSAKELELLSEQRQRLQDRLRALDTREEIFKSAAKSQGSKAPRKTKSNPDPLLTIRQGTDFAIAQLEAVYTARRKTGQELNKIDARIESAKKSSRSGEGSVRITVNPLQGKLTIRYATSEIMWRPHYDLHLAGDGFARLQYSARIVAGTDSSLLKVSPDSIIDGANSTTFSVVTGGSATLASYRFPLSDEQYGTGIYNSFSGLITNTSSLNLPAGEAGLYKSGVYLGKFRFEGISSGRSKVISLGK